MLFKWNRPKVNPARVVIVGAGFAGLAAARELHKRQDVEIMVIDRSNHHLFQPLLYQVATGGLNPSEIASPIRSLFSRSPRTTVMLGSMTGLDPANRTLEVDGGRVTVGYDYLILAVGGKTDYFGHPEWEAHAPGLKSLDDAQRIRERVLLAFERAEMERDPEVRRKLMTMVVIGGGPTGVEMAGALAELRRHVLAHEFKNIRPEQAQILLIEGGPRLLPSFPESVSGTARQELENLGVEVLLGEMVQDIEAGLVRTQNRVIQAENLVWAAGVGGHPLGRLTGAELDRAGRVRITPELHLPGQPRIFCLGDMACLQGKSGKPLPGVAQVAIQQGRRAARNIALLLDGRAPKPFRYFDKGSMATIGRKSAVAVLPGGLTLSGWTAWLGWLAVHLAFIVDLQNRILVILRWGWAYLGWKWNVRLIGESGGGFSASELASQGDSFKSSFEPPDGSKDPATQWWSPTSGLK